MEEIRLVRPALEYGEDIMKFRQEFLEHDPCEDMGGCYELRNCESAGQWVESAERMRSRQTCPEGLVDSDIYLAVRTGDNRIVGVIEFRHHINHPVLGLWGGHIGYCVRPAERRKGYAREMLRQTLALCRDYGVEKVMVTCDEGNIASERTILANGGVYEKTVWSDGLSTYMKRFWIRTDA